MAERQHPVTPSPHRFTSRRDARPREDKPSVTAQFARSPRFNLNARASRNDDSHRVSTLRQVSSRYENIQKSPSRSPEPFDIGNDDDVAQNASEVLNLHDGESTSEGQTAQHSKRFDVDEGLRPRDHSTSFKRRRLSQPERDSGSDSPLASISYRSGRFLPSKPFVLLEQDSSLDPSTTGAQSRERQRPAFLLPAAMSTGSSTTSHPLPDAFSPHRKGQKFLPGGIADTLRGWVVDVASFASVSLVDNRTHAPGKPTYFPKATLHASTYMPEDGSQGAEMPAGSWFIAEGELQDLHGTRTQRKVLCAAKTSSRHDLYVGKDTTIEISPPFWEVNLMGENWLVAVEWNPV